MFLTALSEASVLAGLSHPTRSFAKLLCLVCVVQLFYDILQSDPAAHDSTDQRWEVVVKAGVFGTVQDVKDLRDSLKCVILTACPSKPHSQAQICAQAQQQPHALAPSSAAGHDYEETMFACTSSQPVVPAGWEIS
jgi:hypothetical protein